MAAANARALDMCLPAGNPGDARRYAPRAAPACQAGGGGERYGLLCRVAWDSAKLGGAYVDEYGVRGGVRCTRPVISAAPPTLNRDDASACAGLIGQLPTAPTADGGGGATPLSLPGDGVAGGGCGGDTGTCHDEKLPWPPPGPDNTGAGPASGTLGDGRDRRAGWSTRGSARQRLVVGPERWLWAVPKLLALLPGLRAATGRAGVCTGRGARPVADTHTTPPPEPDAVASPRTPPLATPWLGVTSPAVAPAEARCAAPAPLGFATEPMAASAAAAAASHALVSTIPAMSGRASPSAKLTLPSSVTRSLLWAAAAMSAAQRAPVRRDTTPLHGARGTGVGAP